MDSFVWQPGFTPLSTHRALVLGVFSYLVGIGLLKGVLWKSLHVPTWIAAGHNLVLCLGSLAMFIGTAYECFQVGRR